MKNLVWIKKMHPAADGVQAGRRAILFGVPLGFGPGFRYGSA